MPGAAPSHRRAACRPIDPPVSPHSEIKKATHRATEGNGPARSPHGDGFSSHLKLSQHAARARRRIHHPRGVTHEVLLRRIQPRMSHLHRRRRSAVRSASRPVCTAPPTAPNNALCHCAGDHFAAARTQAAVRGVNCPEGRRSKTRCCHALRGVSRRVAVRRQTNGGSW